MVHWALLIVCFILGFLFGAYTACNLEKRVFKDEETTEEANKVTEEKEEDLLR